VVGAWLTIARNSKRETKIDTKDSVEEARGETRTIVEMQTTMQLGFKNITDSINEVRYDVRAMREQNSQIIERLAKCEASASSAHKRIDDIAKRRDSNAE
jgi:hypothetical protein